MNSEHVNANVASRTNAKGQKDWESIKDEVYKMYIKQHRPLSEVMTTIDTKYNFQAGKRTWKKKLKEWEFDKNISKSALAVVVTKVEKRKWSDGRDTKIFYRGAEVNARKVARAKKSNSKSPASPTARTPDSFSYSTPRDDSREIGLVSPAVDGLSPPTQDFSLITDIIAAKKTALSQKNASATVVMMNLPISARLTLSPRPAKRSGGFNSNNKRLFTHRRNMHLTQRLPSPPRSPGSMDFDMISLNSRDTTRPSGARITFEKIRIGKARGSMVPHGTFEQENLGREHNLPKSCANNKSVLEQSASKCHHSTDIVEKQDGNFIHDDWNPISPAASMQDDIAGIFHGKIAERLSSGKVMIELWQEVQTFHSSFYVAPISIEDRSALKLLKRCLKTIGAEAPFYFELWRQRWSRYMARVSDIEAKMTARENLWSFAIRTFDKFDHLISDKHDVKVGITCSNECQAALVRSLRHSGQSEEAETFLVHRLSRIRARTAESVVINFLDGFRLLGSLNNDPVAENCSSSVITVKSALDMLAANSVIFDGVQVSLEFAAKHPQKPIQEQMHILMQRQLHMLTILAAAYSRSGKYTNAELLFKLLLDYDEYGLILVGSSFCMSINNIMYISCEYCLHLARKDGAREFRESVTKFTKAISSHGGTKSLDQDTVLSICELYVVLAEINKLLCGCIININAKCTSNIPESCCVENGALKRALRKTKWNIEECENRTQLESVRQDLMLKPHSHEDSQWTNQLGSRLAPFGVVATIKPISVSSISKPFNILAGSGSSGRTKFSGASSGSHPFGKTFSVGTAASDCIGLDDSDLYDGW